MTQVVTQLIVDASGAKTGVAEFEAAMKRAKETATRDGNATAQSFEGAQRKWTESLAKTDPVIKAQIAMERDLARQRKVNDDAVRLGITTQAAAAAQLERVRQRHASLISEIKSQGAATGELRNQVSALAAQLGPLGDLLGRVGPGGLAAAAGIGALVLAVNAMVKAANELADAGGKMVDFAETTGLTTTQLQALQKAGAFVGVETEKIGQGFERFTVQMEELRRGTGSLYEGLTRVDPALARQLATTRSAAEAWDLFAKAIASASREEANALAKAAFGRSGIPMTRLAGATVSAGGVAGLERSLGEINTLTTEQLQRWDELKDKIDYTAKVSKQNIASIFTDEVLKRQLQYEESWLRFSQSIKEFKASAGWDAFVLGLKAISPALGAIAGPLGILTSGAASILTAGNGAARQGAYPDESTRGLASARFPVSAPAASTTTDPRFDAAALQKKIEAMGAAATAADKLRLAEQQLAISAKEAGLSAEETARAMGVLRQNFSVTELQNMISALGDAATSADQHSLKLAQLNQQLAQGKISQETYARAVKGATDSFSLQHERDRISLLGDAATASERYALKLREIEEQARKTGQSQEDMDRATRAAKQEFDIQSQRDTISALGDAATETERYQLKMSELQQALDKGAISQETFNRAAAAANPIFKNLRDTAVEFAQTFASAMMQGKSATDALIASADQLGKKLMNQGIDNLLSLDPQKMLTGGIQTAVGWGLQQFQRREQEKKAAEQAEIARQEEIAARNRAKKEMIESYTLRSNLAGLDQTTQAGALEAFDLRAASELKQASRTPGIGRHELVVAEEALAKERLKIIEDFAKQAADLERSYEDRIFAATTDTSTMEGALAAFDRAAQREREQAIEAGGIAIEKLEQALAAERLRVIQDFVSRANAAEARRLGYADRLFAATTDMTTLEGALSAFDRQAQREREQEIADGGEAILELEAALNAERLQVIQSFNSKIVDDTRAAEEQRRAALIQTTQQVLQYIQQLQTGAESPLSPSARLSAAQAAYNSTLALAMQGNEEAYGQFTQVAESLRLAAQAMYGSAAGYQTVFNQIVADGLNLTAPVTSSDPVVAALQDVVTAIGVANGSIVSGNNGSVSAINAVTGAVNTQGGNTTSRLDITNTRVQATTTAVGGTTTAVNTNNSLVTTGNVIANEQVDVAEGQSAILNAIKGLGDIQRTIGNGLGNLQAGIGSNAIYWLEQVRYYTRRTATNTGQSGGGPDTIAPPSWTWTGFESGGVVGNGAYGRDSVMARYAGGGNIMLAGGEGVLTAGATAGIGGRAAIDYINRTGMMPANDNGGVIAAIVAMNASLRAEIQALRAELGKGNGIAAAHLDHDREWGDRDKRQSKVAAPKVTRAA